MKVTGKSLSEALIFASTNPQYVNRLFIELQVQYMKMLLYWQFKTIYVHNMFWACSFHVLNSKFNEQSVDILWVSWCKNKNFWQRLACTENRITNARFNKSESKWSQKQSDFYVSKQVALLQSSERYHSYITLAHF